MADRRDNKEVLHHDQVQWETSVAKRKMEEMTSSDDSKPEERSRHESDPDETIKKKKILPPSSRGILNPSATSATSHMSFMDPISSSHISPEQQTFLGALDSFGALPLNARTVESSGSEPMSIYPLYQQYILQQHHLMDRGMHLKHSTDDHPHSGMAHSDSPVLLPDKSAYRFKLREQPNENQRKSYKKENRCLLPNPLILCPSTLEGQNLPRILEGSCTVKLVDAEGKELPGKSSSLEAIEGGLTHQLDDKLSTSFSLKVLSTSDGSPLRLMFIVNYAVEGIGNCQEIIVSNSFLVNSNRKKTNRDRPIVLDMKANRGPTQVETEVWIKGKGFSNKVVVTFGDKHGRVVDTTENLITVWAPARLDLLQDTTVPVTVSNKFSGDLFPADKRLTFLYQVNFSD